MAAPFFEQPILNSPYAYPTCHWELDADGQPTHTILDYRRGAKFITPVPKPKKQSGSKAKQPRRDRFVSHPMRSLSASACPSAQKSEACLVQ